MSWRNYPFMSVSGCIDSFGAIRAQAYKEIRGHTKELSKGKRWRWIIWTQEFSSIMPLTAKEANNPSLMELTKEENFAVLDWLVRKGYADEKLIIKD